MAASKNMMFSWLYKGRKSGHPCGRITGELAASPPVRGRRVGERHEELVSEGGSEPAGGEGAAERARRRKP
jgi:hypothetical protein